MEDDKLNEEVVEDVKVDETNEEQKEEKTFTQEEVNKIIQERLAKEKAKNDKAQEEAKKLAKMNAEEKAKYEIEKAQSELKKREEEVTRRELTAEAKSILSEKGLSTDLFSLLNYESAETVQESIKVLETAIQKATEKAVEDRLKGNAPKKEVTPPSQATGFDKVIQKYKK